MLSKFIRIITHANFKLDITEVNSSRVRSSRKRIRRCHQAKRQLSRDRKGNVEDWAWPRGLGQREKRAPPWYHSTRNFTLKL